MIWGNLMRKVLLTGVGAALLTKEKIEEVVAELVRQGAINTEEGSSLSNELMNRANAERERLGLKIREEIQRNMRESGLVTEVELSQLKQEVTLLRQRVVELENHSVQGD